LTSKRTRSRAAYFRQYNRAKGRRASAPERAGTRQVIGIDGEGYSLPDGSHRYVYLAASDAAGLVAETRNPKGLSADEVFRFLVALPRKALLVGFALGYDKTKWLESWPDERVWRLMRPEERQGKTGPFPVDCEGWRVNLVSTRFTVKRADEETGRTVWDVWKFFQSSFVKALDRWDIGKTAQRRFIAKQKERRGAFEGIGPTEERYCQLECALLAELVTKLLEAHEQAGVRLQSFYGPGSSSAVVLAEMGADLQKARYPERMALAVMCGYFGGRFELSRMGPVARKRLYAYDIASAYPWAFTRIPCLRKGHGTWVRRKSGRLRGTHPVATLVRFRVDPHARAHPAWGPLPHRTPKGDILFPLESAGGWAWREEFEAGRKLHPGVKALESWYWRPRCSCAPPYAERVRELFALRKEWGKSARGLVIKLLLNSLYGKSAQRQGKGRFRCMVRAGLVTSMTRARLLQAVAMAPRPWDVLELATDSVLSLSPIPGLQAVAKDPELGAWETKPWEGGVFLLRPGIRFPLLPKSDASMTAARGINTKTLHKNRAKVLRAWRREPMAPVELHTPSFFHGAKLAVRAGLGPMSDEGREALYTRSPLYGTWTHAHGPECGAGCEKKPETRTVKYDAKPKREAVQPDYRLEPWRLPRGAGCESVPYGVALQSTIGDELERMRELEDEQAGGAPLAMV
jgi:hypothetical protein